ncbi:MAG: murein biosynthesis integral membrane protein MurJ [Gemmatimonadetes bacterium]|nr:murein biosynthesis integral membrane protein MurJ [Gemmatimonadota bacterium]
MTRDPSAWPDRSDEPDPLAPDPDATLPMPPARPEAIEAGALAYDPADDAVEPAAAVPEAARSSTAASGMIAIGILLSRVAGLVRTRVVAMFFGTSAFADVFAAGMRMPNLLQNLLGEGVLSASFIPVYSELLHQGRKKEAGQVAGAIFSLLFAAAGALALIGVLLAPVIVTIFMPGLDAQRYALTVSVTRIVFPMAGILVLSAWALGILNSHRNFFLPYFAPVLWNAAMIATLLAFGRGMQPGELVVLLAWGALAGGVLQFGVQLPRVLQLERELKLGWGLRIEGVREAVRNAGPAVVGRGVVQISGYLDYFLASFLAAGALATLQFAQLFYMLPISLFAMSVAAAELPELSRQRSAGDEVLRGRASAGLERVAFYVVPSFVAFALLGDVVVATLLQTGEFDRTDTLVVYLTLVGFSVGLLATTASRMLSTTFFALRDTRTPARYAIVRVVLSAALAVILMTQLESIRVERLGLDLPGGILSHLRIGDKQLGVIGLALGTGIAAWVEWALLKRALRNRIGSVGAGAGPVARMFAAALAGAAAGWALRMLLPEALHIFLRGVLVLGTFGVVYFGVAAALGLEQSGAILRRIKGKLGRR